MSGCITRRVFALSLPVLLGGCVVGNTPPPSPSPVNAVPTKPVTTTPLAPLPPQATLGSERDPSDVKAYAAITDDQFGIPATDVKKIDPAFLRRTVDYSSSEAPGTIIVDPGKRYLYLILGDGKAIRYGVGVGREGFGWTGEAYIRSKQEWPKWFPPADMRARQPDLQKYAPPNGMSGGPSNPLGARAMYLWQGDHDTYYRLHGTTEPESIGKNMSSGCIRMINQDAFDLYSRAAVNAKVVVLPSKGATTLQAEIEKSKLVNQADEARLAKLSKRHKVGG
jgi:lipoprotein-anchoring transpeptidase ErfK/SrfK